MADYRSPNGQNSTFTDSAAKVEKTFFSRLKPLIAIRNHGIGKAARKAREEQISAAAYELGKRDGRSEAYLAVSKLGNTADATVAYLNLLELILGEALHSNIGSADLYLFSETEDALRHIVRSGRNGSIPLSQGGPACEAFLSNKPLYFFSEKKDSAFINIIGVIENKDVITHQRLGIIELSGLNGSFDESVQNVFINLSAAVSREIVNFRSSTKDSLTGLFTKLRLVEEMETQMTRSHRYAPNAPLSLIVLDLDGFKELNDIEGHMAGDAKLKEVAAIIKSSVRKIIDSPARFGGDEFAVLLPDTNLEGAKVLAERIRAEIKQKTGMNCSVGAYQLNNEQTVAEFFEKTDKWLYYAKNTGKSKVCAPEQIGGLAPAVPNSQ